MVGLGGTVEKTLMRVNGKQLITIFSVLNISVSGAKMERGALLFILHRESITTH